MNHTRDTDFPNRIIKLFGKAALSFIILILLYLTIIATIGRTSLISKDLSETLINYFHGKNFILITDYRIEDFKHYLNSDNVFQLDSVLNFKKPEYFQYALDFLENKYKMPVAIILKTNDDPLKEALDKNALMHLKIISIVKCYEYKNASHKYAN